MSTPRAPHVDAPPAPPTLFDPPPADPPPAARTSDPDTSHEAARGLGDRHPVREWILTLIEELGPLTDHDIAEQWQNARTHLSSAPPSSPSGLRTRRAELVDSGHLVAGDKVSLPNSPRSAYQWVRTDLPYPTESTSA